MTLAEAIRESGWTLVPIPKIPSCDLCDRFAAWQHPAGGFRCGECPRPEQIWPGQVEQTAPHGEGM